jgi:hypothetical protein
VKFRLTTETNRTVTIDVQPGDNIWITNENGDDIGSLYLSQEADTLGLGCYDETAGGWEYAETIAVTLPARYTDTEEN